MYSLVQDGENALDPDTADLFDREANTFASEVLFQLEAFRDQAEAMPFDIFTPVRLATKFNASNYAAIRQYVSKNHRTCVVVVLNMPELDPVVGFRAALRRVVASESFLLMFAGRTWPEVYTPDDDIGRFVPLHGRRASGKRQLGLGALLPETVRWDHSLVGVERGNGALQLIFETDAVEADLVLACDGGWSRCRSLVSDIVQPTYSGVVFVQTLIHDVDVRQPEVAELVGPGSILALGDDRGLLAQRNGDGSIRIYVALRIPEDWAKNSGLNFSDAH